MVVDTFAEHRQRDVLNLAEELEYNHAADQKFLENIFQRIDTDGSGQVTFEELLEGARRDPEFQSRLRVMDIDARWQLSPRSQSALKMCMKAACGCS